LKLANFSLAFFNMLEGVSSFGTKQAIATALGQQQNI
jgi:L-lactate permease